MQLIILNNYSKIYELEQIRLQLTIFAVLYFITATHHFHSTKLVQVIISKICDLLPSELNLMIFGGVAHHNQKHEE